MTSFKENLRKGLIQRFGEKKGEELARKYANAFPHHYQDEQAPEAAEHDVILLEQLSPENKLSANLYLWKTGEHPLHLKLLQLGEPITLSDILPVLDNMGLRTFNERPYKITLADNTIAWISDFGIEVLGQNEINIEAIKPIFIDALKKIILNTTENDGFNGLVLKANLSEKEIIILRSYAKYMQQTGFRFSQHYIEKTLAYHPDIACDLVKFFLLKFDLKKKSADVISAQEEVIKKKLESVSSLDEDRILRYFLEIMKATLRVNYFKQEKMNYLCFKLSSHEVPELPLPRPLFEIFVYSPRFEGIHLRSEKVARGGIRWSDRREDFRTEILGLMKAQKVKNAVIAPSGAKGGFVLKAVPANATREILQNEVVSCYKFFISALLDLTDNIKNAKIIRPENVLCYDDEDPYLVVAADKGTATFSDTANSISAAYDFWLGDAFASGGSKGYDHKKMGITARGAWESVKRHFRDSEIDIDQDFTVVGIGDMSGDVFGNGALYTPHIKLVAAFDHRDIFLDPDPDTAKAYAERKRLFQLSGSSWTDYDSKLISKGGGVFKRSSKSIPLSSEVKKILDIKEDALTPNELIRAILKAPVDLLFNGGIGTYVKASTESHADVGDRTNEFVRINGCELRCRVVGEGGNLGFTQLGRVEYALQGGLINTDFIDNSAGVDCSDHEVNIKILLNQEMAKGNLQEADRDILLAKMTEEIAALVLNDNYHQALAISNAKIHATEYLPLYQTYIKELETSGFLDRAVEFLPDDKKILERKAAGRGLMAPELAVLLAYTKIYIKNELLKSNLPEDGFYARMLETAFPETLCKIYGKNLREHRLYREIISTQLSNQIVNNMGITFVYRMQIETGASVSDVVRAYSITLNIYSIAAFQERVESLRSKIPLKTQYELFGHIRRLQNLSTRWFLRSNRLNGQVGDIIKHYAAPIKEIETYVPKLMVGTTRQYLEMLTAQFMKAGLEEDLAEKIAVNRALYTALNIIEVATEHHFDLKKTAKIYFDVGRDFNLVWFRDQIASDNREGHWNSLARLTLRDELDILQKKLTVVIMNCGQKELDHAKLNGSVMERWNKILALLHGSATVDYVMFFIALHELADLIKTV